MLYIYTKYAIFAHKIRDSGYMDDRMWMEDVNDGWNNVYAFLDDPLEITAN